MGGKRGKSPFPYPCNTYFMIRFFDHKIIGRSGSDMRIHKRIAADWLTDHCRGILPQIQS